MGLELEVILTNLKDAGCGVDIMKQVTNIYENGDEKELIHYLKCCRCSLMDDLHESQRRVDCLDFLIRKADKSRI